MNILITGGYGFVGLYIAERFYKEGHKIYILDNLASGVCNIGFKHKFFRMDVEDKGCDDIFRVNTFDVVVHLAARTNIPASCENPYDDSMSNVVGLVNILNLSSKYNVKRFIFLSSASVYGTGKILPSRENAAACPESPHAVGKLFGEEYCRLYNEAYGLSTVILRASNIYGFKKWDIEKTDVISEFIKNVIQGKDIQVYGDGSRTRDFVYVEDVADAVYRCVESDYNGIMNLSSKTETSINELIEKLKNLAEIKNIIYNPPLRCDLSRSFLDNSKIKRELDWVPMYTLEEGLAKTFEKYAAEYKKIQKDKAAGKEKKNDSGDTDTILSRAVPYVENFLLFAVVFFIDLFLPALGDFIFIDLKLVYIILIGVVYGTRHSIIAVALSTFLFILDGYYKGHDIISLFYDSNSLMNVAFYIFIGFFVGYTIDIKNRSVKSYINQSEVIRKKFDFLNNIYNDTKSVKDELQKQIRMSEDSLTKVYSIIKELDTLNPEQIYSSAIKVIERIMKTKSVALYVLSKNGYYARLVANSSSDMWDLKKSIKIENYPELKDIMETKDVFANKSMNRELPMMAVPIVDNGSVLALLALYNLDFDNVNLYYQNLFKIVANFISSSLSKAVKYQEAIYNDSYIAGTNIMKKEYFDEMLKIRIHASENNISSYVLLNVKLNGDYAELDQKIGRSIRETDFMGQGQDGILRILLTNTGENDAKNVIRRLSDIGVAASFEMGDDRVA